MPADTPAFAGFPVAALDFYDDLEVDNTRSFWEKHKAVYTESVRRPMEALCEALAPEFGAAKVFRPYRDVRFAKEKSTVFTTLSWGAVEPAGCTYAYPQAVGEDRQRRRYPHCPGSRR